MKKLNKIEICWLALIFLTPTYLISCLKVEGFPFSFVILTANLWEILVILGLVILAFEYYKNKESNNIKLREFFKKSHDYWWPIGCILFGLIMATLKSESSAVSLGIIKGWFFVPFLVGMGISLVIKPQKKEAIGWVWFFSALAIGLISLTAGVMGKYTFDFRLSWPFNSPNYLAMFLVPGIIIGLAFWKKSPYWISFGLLIIFSALILTRSYAALLAWGLSFFVTAFFLGYSKNKKSWLIIFILGLFLWTGLFLSSDKGQMILSSSGRSSWDSRLMIWRSAKKIIIDNYLLGIGPGQFQEKYLQYQKHFPPYLQWAVPHPHNIFLTFWLYSGLLGLIGFGWLLVIFFKKLIKNHSGEWQFILMSIMLYFLIHGLVDTTYFKNDLATFFWVVIFQAL